MSYGEPKIGGQKAADVSAWVPPSTTACGRQKYDYEQAADAWQAARERRDLARSAHERATTELEAAENEERNTWGQLEVLAGHGPVPPPAPTPPRR